MSKPWFLDMAMNLEDCPLAGTVAQILGKDA